MHHGAIAFNLIVAGQTLREHQFSSTTREGLTTVSSYVECVENQAFVVRLAAQCASSDLQCHIKLDGVFVHGRDVKRGNLVQSDLIGPRASLDGTLRKPFVFKQMQLTEEDDEGCNDEQITRHLGTISVEVFECTKGPSVLAKTLGRSSKTASDSVFSEKSKKAALSHVSGLGNAIATGSPPQPIYNTTYTWVAEKPLVVFVWKYRSRALLEAEGIIATAPAPVPAPTPALVQPPRNSSTLVPKRERKPIVTPIASGSGNKQLIDLAGDSDNELPTPHRKKVKREAKSEYKDPIVIEDHGVDVKPSTLTHGQRIDLT